MKINTVSFKTEIIEIAKDISEVGGCLFLVGGAVRDHFINRIHGENRIAKDQDFMIQGITEQKAKEIVSKFGKIKDADIISNAPVFMCRIDDEDFEFAMARIEVDTAPGKSGFQFISNPEVTLEDDLIRRDFTIGAICMDVLTGGIIDPHNGIGDVRNKVIRAVNAETFVQSPERAFRAFSQAARFGFDIDWFTRDLIRSMMKDFHSIPTEQIWRHFEKFANDSVTPDKFLMLLYQCHWDSFFPEINFDRSLVSLFNLRGTKFAVCDVLAAIMVDMSFEEENRFRSRICIPKQVFKKAVEIKDNGKELPKRWVEGRDIAHIVPAGKEMGFWTRWAFVSQINNLTKDREDTILWIEKSIKENG